LPYFLHAFLSVPVPPRSSIPVLETTDRLSALSAVGSFIRICPLLPRLPPEMTGLIEGILCFRSKIIYAQFCAIILRVQSILSAHLRLCQKIPRTKRIFLNCQASKSRA
jgi:hypothetical protein